MSDTATLDTPLATAVEPTESGTGGADAIFARWTQTQKETPPETIPAPETTSAPDQENTTTPAQGETLSPQKLKWNELKAKADERDELVSKKLPSLEQELAALKAKAADLEKVDPTRYEAQIKEKEAKLAEYEKKIALQDVRESDQFKQEVIEPYKKIGQKIDRIAQTYGANANELKDALTITDPKAQRERLTELMADFDAADQAAVRGLVNESLDLYEKAQHLEANAAEVKKEIEFTRHQENEKKKTESQKQLQASADAVKKQFMEKMPDFFKDEEVQKKVFAADLTRDDPTMRAYRAFAGEAVPALWQQLAAAKAQIATLEKSISERNGVSVRAGGGQNGQQVDTTPQVPQGETGWQRWQSYQTQRA